MPGVIASRAKYALSLCKITDQFGLVSAILIWAQALKAVPRLGGCWSVLRPVLLGSDAGQNLGLAHIRKRASKSLSLECIEPFWNAVRFNSNRFVASVLRSDIDDESRRWFQVLEVCSSVPATIPQVLFNLFCVFASLNVLQVSREYRCNGYVDFSFQSRSDWLNEVPKRITGCASSVLWLVQEGWDLGRSWSVKIVDSAETYACGFEYQWKSFEEDQATCTRLGSERRTSCWVWGRAATILE